MSQSFSPPIRQWNWLIIPTDARDRPGHAVPLYVRATPEMTTVLITECLQRDSADPIGPHDPPPSLLPVGYSDAARPLGPSPSAGWGWVPGSDPTGRDRRHTASACARLWRRSGVSWPTGKAARDHLQHELIHRVEETERPF